MCQLLGMNCATPTDFTFSFQGFCQRGGITNVHSHGWGLAFYEGRRGIRCFHDTQPAADSEIAKFLSNYPIQTLNMMAHIRYATRGHVDLANVHPFQRELWGIPWTFCHNGDVPLAAYQMPVLLSSLLSSSSVTTSSTTTTITDSTNTTDSTTNTTDSTTNTTDSTTKATDSTTNSNSNKNDNGGESQQQQQQEQPQTPLSRQQQQQQQQQQQHQEVYYHPIGDTDSERIFCAMLNALRTRFQTLPTLPVLYDAIEELCREIVEYDPSNTIFNFLLACGPHVLWAYSWPGQRMGSNVWNALYYIVRQPPFTTATLRDLDYTVDFGLQTTSDDRVSVIATEPLTYEEEWVEFQKGQLIVFDQGLPHMGATSLFPIELQGRGLHDSQALPKSQLEEDMRRYQYFHAGSGI